MEINLPRLFSMSEVASYLDVSERTLRREIQRGRLSVSQVGRSPKFTQQQIEDYLGLGRIIWGAGKRTNYSASDQTVNTG